VISERRAISEGWLEVRRSPTSRPQPQKLEPDPQRLPFKRVKRAAFAGWRVPQEFRTGTKLPERSTKARFFAGLSADRRAFLESQGVLVDESASDSAPIVPQGQNCSETTTRLTQAETTSAPNCRRPEPARNRDHERYQRDLRWLEKRRVELAAREGAPRDFQVIPREVWSLAESCMGSRRALYLELARLGNRAAAGALIRAAFGFGSRDWQSSYAIHVLVLGLALCALYRPTHRKGRFARLVDGIPIEALCALLRDPRTGHTPCAGTLSHRHHRPDGDLYNGQIGYLHALELTGFLSRLQRQKPSRERPDILPSCNQYWILAHSAYLFGDVLAWSLELIDEADSLSSPFAPRGPP
jgi:hypothetical protein